MSKEHYIGLMSGTSLDAIDAVLVDLSTDESTILMTHSTPMPLALKKQIQTLCHPSNNELNQMGEADKALGELFSEAVFALLKKANLAAKDIRAIGSHGQTIRHMPHAENPFTIQIGDPNTMAALTQITTVADFRRRDIALGGQGAPLTPAFHQHLLQHHDKDHWVLNIGGIANLTLLSKSQSIIGFDTGPGNTLLDAWCAQHLHQPYDKHGQWARTGKTHLQLLSILLNDAYFTKPAPKSTGREYFNLTWLKDHMAKLDDTPSAEDVQATLIDLTAQSIIHSINEYDTLAETIWVCGGGAHNTRLMETLDKLSPNLQVETTEKLGIHPDWVEAVAFAWLAKRTLAHLPGNIPAVTGAKKESILGAIYPAN